MGLLVGEYFCRGEVFEVLVVCKNEDWSSRAFKVVSPLMEGFKNCLEFFIMSVIILFGCL